ncbi:hypothetical protein [Flavobacterium saliperosum]|uniref:CarboxypepD_reg-like domain-containing protein n=1 Tax=Flavobacterium saliperosum TaxID=329186 RepID=A0A1G4V610_9FLAO|nr:hypothetical protein [Flavobacterium saliperosum]SCX01797.1 hypothetical protein SAMN02927925_00403 [Flavobacterium saliperosum]
MRGKLLVFFLLISTITWSQNGRVLKGKVVANSKDLQGINIRNLSSKREALSSEEGFFSIKAKPGDTLLFTAVQLKSKKTVVEKEDFDYLPFVVKMELMVTQLKEVVIKESVSAESLGIVPKGMKTYTPAERRLYTATTGSGFVSVDAIINAISGRTSMIKKEIVVEKHQTAQRKLGNMFDGDFLIKEFNIQKEYIDGFIVYASENPKVKQALKEKNKTLVTFLLGELATEYNKFFANAK